MNYFRPSQAPQPDAWGHDPEVKKQDYKDHQATLAKQALRTDLNVSDTHDQLFGASTARHRMSDKEVAAVASDKPINYSPAGLHKKKDQ